MIAINMQESNVQEVKAFFEKLKLSLAALLDSNGEVATGFAVNALPTTFVLDKEAGLSAQPLDRGSGTAGRRWPCLNI